MDYRTGEKSGTFFRSERYYCINGQWFFSTREGEELGPFETQDEAEVELMLYIRHIGDGGFLSGAAAAAVKHH